MLHQIDPKTLTENVFSLIGDRWTLITAGTREACNTMTAAWGGLGVLWKKPVATIFVRPQRYTYSFVEGSEYFTLTFFGEGEQREALALCGTKSGRDMDKFAASGLTVAEAPCGAPYVAEGKLVLVCRKLYRQELTQDCFVDQSLVDIHYPEKDFHTMYVGEIVEAYGRD